MARISLTLLLCSGLLSLVSTSPVAPRDLQFPGATQETVCCPGKPCCEPYGVNAEAAACRRLVSGSCTISKRDALAEPNALPKPPKDTSIPTMGPPVGIPTPRQMTPLDAFQLPQYAACFEEASERMDAGCVKAADSTTCAQIAQDCEMKVWGVADTLEDILDGPTATAGVPAQGAKASTGPENPGVMKRKPQLLDPFPFGFPYPRRGPTDAGWYLISCVERHEQKVGYVCTREELDEVACNAILIACKEWLTDVAELVAGPASQILEGFPTEADGEPEVAKRESQLLNPVPFPLTPPRPDRHDYLYQSCLYEREPLLGYPCTRAEPDQRACDALYGFCRQWNRGRLGVAPLNTGPFEVPHAAPDNEHALQARSNKEGLLTPDQAHCLTRLARESNVDCTSKDANVQKGLCRTFWGWCGASTVIPRDLVEDGTFAEEQSVLRDGTKPVNTPDGDQVACVKQWAIGDDMNCRTDNPATLTGKCLATWHHCATLKRILGDEFSSDLIVRAEEPAATPTLAERDESDAALIAPWSFEDDRDLSYFGKWRVCIADEAVEANATCNDYAAEGEADACKQVRTECNRRYPFAAALWWISNILEATDEESFADAPTLAERDDLDTEHEVPYPEDPQDTCVYRLTRDSDINCLGEQVDRDSLACHLISWICKPARSPSDIFSGLNFEDTVATPTLAKRGDLEAAVPATPAPSDRSKFEQCVRRGERNMGYGWCTNAARDGWKSAQICQTIKDRCERVLNGTAPATVTWGGSKSTTPTVTPKPVLEKRLKPPYLDKIQYSLHQDMEGGDEKRSVAVDDSTPAVTPEPVLEKRLKPPYIDKIQYSLAQNYLNPDGKRSVAADDTPMPASRPWAPPHHSKPTTPSRTPGRATPTPTPSTTCEPCCSSPTPTPVISARTPPPYVDKSQASLHNRISEQKRSVNSTTPTTLQTITSRKQGHLPMLQSKGKEYYVSMAALASRNMAEGTPSTHAPVTTTVTLGDQQAQSVAPWKTLFPGTNVYPSTIPECPWWCVRLTPPFFLEGARQYPPAQ